VWDDDLRDSRGESLDWGLGLEEDMCGLRRGGGVYNRLSWPERVGHCDVHPVQRDTKSAMQKALVGLLNAIEYAKGRMNYCSSRGEANQEDDRGQV
jgi:hypothetical protein